MLHARKFFLCTMHSISCALHKLWSFSNCGASQTYSEAEVPVDEAWLAGSSVTEHEVLQFPWLREALFLDHQLPTIFVHHTVLERERGKNERGKNGGGREVERREIGKGGERERKRGERMGEGGR